MFLDCDKFRSSGRFPESPAITLSYASINFRYTQQGISESISTIIFLSWTTDERHKTCLNIEDSQWTRAGLDFETAKQLQFLYIKTTSIIVICCSIAIFQMATSINQSINYETKLGADMSRRLRGLLSPFGCNFKGRLFDPQFGG